MKEIWKLSLSPLGSEPRVLWENLKEMTSGIRYLILTCQDEIDTKNIKLLHNVEPGKMAEAGFVFDDRISTQLTSFQFHLEYSH